MRLLTAVSLRRLGRVAVATLTDRASHWNCRIRTESRSPKAIMETTIEEPP
jgi:hypothetical protein